MAKLSTKEKKRIAALKEKEQPVPIPERFSKSSVITPRMMASFLNVGLSEILHAMIEIQGPTEAEQILHKTAIRGLCKKYGTHLPWGEPLGIESTGIDDQDEYHEYHKPEFNLKDFAEFLEIDIPRLRLLVRNRCRQEVTDNEILSDGILKLVCAHLGKRLPKGM